MFGTELSWRRDVELQMNPWNLELAMKSRVSDNRIVGPEELQSGQNHLNFSSQSSDISLIKIAHNCQQKLLFAPSAIGSEQTVKICPWKNVSQWRNDCYYDVKHVFVEIENDGLFSEYKQLIDDCVGDNEKW